MNYTYDSASLEDMAQIFQLYAKEYRGTYPDKTFSSVEKLELALGPGNDKHIFVSKKESGHVCACILFQYDPINLIAKAGGAVVDEADRGNDLTENLIRYGIDYLNSAHESIEVLYVTTRTVHMAAQVLTRKMGFQQLGIFPNIHKTTEYETHALSAMFFGNALERRYTDFKQHPMVGDLYNIVQNELSLPKMEITNDWLKKTFTGALPVLEVIEAPEFVSHRMNKLVETEKLDLAFFPFHKPTLVITSPDQEVEVYAHVNETDKYCVITGCRIGRDVSFEKLFLKIGSILRDRGVRYIEVIIKANRLNIIDKICEAKFIPCGYFPAFQLEDGLRYDYVVFSRSFEILDFNNMEIDSNATQYLANYINLWKKRFLGKFFS